MSFPKIIISWSEAETSNELPYYTVALYLNDNNNTPDFLTVDDLDVLSPFDTCASAIADLCLGYDVSIDDINIVWDL